ncbi:MAG TPA: hypothetical protein VLQ90_02030, partial [Pyrinomonadaceae bacterium]|nr:hypothetical protein [Pyrinomonadaceae bacterium]
ISRRLEYQLQLGSFSGSKAQLKLVLTPLPNQATAAIAALATDQIYSCYTPGSLLTISLLRHAREN